MTPEPRPQAPPDFIYRLIRCLQHLFLSLSEEDTPGKALRRSPQPGLGAGGPCRGAVPAPLSLPAVMPPNKHLFFRGSPGQTGRPFPFSGNSSLWQRPQDLWSEEGLFNHENVPDPLENEPTLT